MLENRRTKIAVIVVLATAAGAGAFAWRRSRAGAHGHAAVAKTTYTCPMHPQIVRDKPGECPICGMALVRKETAAQTSPLSASPEATTSGGRRILHYRHPMNPSIHSDRPAKDDMGMDYVPVYEDETTGAHAIAGRAPVVVPPERRELLGIRSEEVRVSGAGGQIKTVGRVAIDEGRKHHVHAKYPGFVEHLSVGAVSEPVRAGQPLARLFSPEVVAAQEEYLVALRARRDLGASDVPEVARGGSDLAAAARQRLAYLDLSAAEIAQLERTGKALRAVTVRADRSGFVTEKIAFHGMRVTPGERLFEIADISQVWVLAQVYERDLPSVRPGGRARVVLPNAPGREWGGRVALIAPVLDDKTRTAEVRIEVANRDGALRPEMYADVWLAAVAGSALVAPESAVIRTGERTLVFVDRGEGRYEPREIVLGPRVADGYQVLSGLAAGERVVVSANFLLDSESSLRAALARTASPRP